MENRDKTYENKIKDMFKHTYDKKRNNKFEICKDCLYDILFNCLEIAKKERSQKWKDIEYFSKPPILLKIVVKPYSVNRRHVEIKLSNLKTKTKLVVNMFLKHNLLLKTGHISSNINNYYELATDFFDDQGFYEVVGDITDNVNMQGYLVKKKCKLCENDEKSEEENSQEIIL